MIYKLMMVVGAPPWSRMHDQNTSGFCTEKVERAATECQAREIAALHCCDEGMDAWRNPAYSTCEIIESNAAAGEISSNDVDDSEDGY